MPQCVMTAQFKVTYPDEDPYFLCRDHIEVADPNCGQYYKKDNPMVEVLVTT